MKFTYLFTFIFAASLFVSCKKEEEQADKYSKYPIVLSGVGSFGSADLTWTPINSKDFIQYQVLISITGDTISDKLENGFIVGQSSDAETSSLTVNSSFVNNGQKTTDSTYYRVIARLKDRVVMSNNLLIKRNNFLQYAGSITSGLYDAETSTLVTVDVNKNKLVKINLVTKKVESAPLSVSTSSFSTGNLLINTVNGVKEIVLKSYSSASDLYIYDFNTLKLLKKITTNNSIYSMTTDGNGFIYAADYNYINVINRLTNTQVAYNTPNGSSTYPRMMFVPNTNKILVLKENFSSGSNSQLSYFNLSADHKIIGSETNIVLADFLSNNSDFSNTNIMEDNTFLIPSLLSIRDKNLVEIGTIPFSFSGFSNSSILLAKKSATEYYVATNVNTNTGGFGSDVSIFKLPDTFLRKKTYLNIFVSGIYPVGNDELIIMYQTNFGSSNSTTNFEKVKI